MKPGNIALAQIQQADGRLKTRESTYHWIISTTDFLNKF